MYALVVLVALGLLDPGGHTPLPQYHRVQSADLCGVRMARQAGLDVHDARTVIRDLRRYSSRVDLEFMQYLYSVAYVESRFRQDRTSPKGAMGILQVTHDAAKHVHALRSTNGIPVESLQSVLEKLPYLPTNVNTGSYYLHYCLGLANGDWSGALVCYNGGPGRLTRYVRGDSIPNETAQYVLQVQQLVASCRRD